MTDTVPLVSAVIPTRNRPDLVSRAVRSVLNQSFQNLEAVVVVDGPDSSTVEALLAIGDPRIRIVALDENVGGSEARNVGARNARGKWIALLDDDDEWLPHKIASQLQAAEKSQSSYVLVASRFVDRSSSGDLIRPRVLPGKGEPISEFLFCRVSWLGGISGFPQTSTWMMSRQLLLERPFTKGQRTLQDLDWLLRGVGTEDCEVVCLPEPLVIFQNDSDRDRVTKKVDWRYSFDWAMENRKLFTRKALSFFITIFCVNPASQQRQPWSTKRMLLRSCYLEGELSPKMLFLFLLYAFIYPIIHSLVPRHKLAGFLYRLKNSVSPVR